MVPVVVRDRQGKAVGTLRQENFRLFDKNKPQTISKFSLEKRGGSSITIQSDAAAEGQGDKTAVVLPERFVAYLFDDVHLEFGDLARARDAAIRHLTTSLQPTDRAAIYTMSGKPTLEFTDDRTKMMDTLNRIGPRSRMPHASECPPMTHYMADLIQNKNDTVALGTAAADAKVCANIAQQTQAETMARSAAMRTLSMGDMETRQALSVLREVVRRLSTMPGQRSIVLVSPGFLITDSRWDEVEIMDRAIRSSVLINSLDARGLYTDAGGDASQITYDMGAGSTRMRYAHEAALTNADVMAELADGTGGTFFQNSNDLVDGFKRLAEAPEYYYVLGFSPQNLKLDGSFHKLKVTLVNTSDLKMQVRRGYYAPKKSMEAADQAKQDIEEAVFSREVMQDIPIELRTQFYKSTDTDAKLSVLSRVDLRHLHFRKAEGRNRDDLTIVSALFDRNGNYVAATTKVVEMRLKDETLAAKPSLPITVKTSFDVKPGTYVVRLVVRDSEGQAMAAQNVAVDIP